MHHPGRIVALLMVLAVLSACQHRPLRPDVSGTEVTPVSISRYEQALFRLDQGKLVPGLDSLSGEFGFSWATITATR